MKRTYNNMIRTLSLVVVVSIFFISSVSAIGVANSYWDDKPLKLAPGESTTISLRLQNEETDPITMEVSMNSEIAALVDGTTYEVPTGYVSIPVYIKVSIPEEASVGTVYTIPVSFKQVSSGEGEGFFQVAKGITGKVPVEVVGEEESELYGTPSGLSPVWYVVIGIIVLGILIAVLRRHPKK